MSYQPSFSGGAWKRLKYSACYFPTKTTTLDQAEELALQLYCERAQLKMVNTF